jgi:glucosamine kinase
MMDKGHDKTLLVIDGGGTKTRAVVAPLDDPQAPLLSQIEVSPSNFGQVGSEGLKKVAEEIVTGLPRPLRQVSAVVAGLAGVGRNVERQKAEEALRQVFANVGVVVRTDAELAYYGAFGLKKNGILIIAGTGSIAWTRLVDGRFLRAGGWGPLLGDEGGGAWMGREALRVCLAEGERNHLGALAQAILRKLKIEKADDILTLVYHQGWSPERWASLAPLIFEHAAEDSGAHDLIERAGAFLGELAARLAAQMPRTSQAIPVAVVGGLTAQWKLLEPSFLASLTKNELLRFQLVKPIGDALFGGRLIAQETGNLGKNVA